MKFKVFSKAFTRIGRKPVKLDRKDRITGSHFERCETINTTTNELFDGLKTKTAVKQVYESFWNDMNPTSYEVVKVVKVEIA